MQVNLSDEMVVALNHVVEIAKRLPENFVPADLGDRMFDSHMIDFVEPLVSGLHEDVRASGFVASWDTPWSR